MPTARPARAGRGSRRRRLRAISRSPAAVSSTRRCGAASRARGSGSARSRRGRRRRSAWRSAAASSSARARSAATSSRRFVASAAESGIDVFRLEDPLNDVSNLREAGEAITDGRPGVRRGPHLQPRPPAARRSSSSRRRSSPSSERRASSCTTRPGRSSRTGRNELVDGARRGERASRRALLPGRRPAVAWPPRSRRRGPERT